MGLDKKKKRKKESRGFKLAQVSVEYVMVLSALLLILMVLMLAFANQYAQQGMAAQQEIAWNALSVASKNARSAWESGPLAEKKFMVTLPASIDFNKSKIRGKTLQLYLIGFGDITQALPFNISGKWPEKSGPALMSAYNNGSMIIIQPAAGIVANVSGIYMSMQADGSGNSTMIMITNTASEDYTILQELECPQNALCTYNGTSGMLGAGEWQIAALNISSFAPGIYSGKLSINATSPVGSSLANKSLIIPITILVK
jgi:uncharacterized protein (UPF0333 family)